MVAFLMVWMVGCSCDGTTKTIDTSRTNQDSGSVDTCSTAEEICLRIYTTLDGVLTEGVLISQPGTERRWHSNAEGYADIQLTTSVVGDLGVAASHPSARIRGEEFGFIDRIPSEYTIELESFSLEDHIDYIFQDPGTPERNDTTNQCSHCHVSINNDWIASMHAQSASNFKLHDLYSGTSNITDEAACVAQGGDWRLWPRAGSDEEVLQCMTPSSLWAALNSECATADCDGNPAQVNGGFCADCHAPGMDGELGGRNLLEARDFAYEYGVHCDVCHKVESINLDSDQPGIAGALNILRPEPPPFAGSIENALTFGPNVDVLNPRMGLATRAHFQSADFCFGCHQFEQPVLVDDAYDQNRWPDGKLPIHSTYAELKNGPLSEVSCQSCHMPPNPEIGNSADLGNIIDLEPGITAGWYRLPGKVRHHGWYGPRSEMPMLELAAALDLEVQIGADIQVQMTITNRGPGHALPTGEPSRMLIALIDVQCDGEDLPLSTGPVVSDIAGFIAQKNPNEDWETWPQAQVGDVLRVISRGEDFYDYNGFSPFELGNWEPSQKGLPQEYLLGQSRVIAKNGDQVILDQELPEGDTVYLLRNSEIVDGMDSVGWAGHAGFTFARVLTDGNGQQMVPHFAAVDVLRDNRLLPQESWTGTFFYPKLCENPEVIASLLYRSQPLWLSMEKGWESKDRLMVQERR